jgi:hypothetical protein
MAGLINVSTHLWLAKACFAGRYVVDGVRLCGVIRFGSKLGFGHARRQACALEAMALSVLRGDGAIEAEGIPVFS